ncbi:unnamed protein product [Miscanthus lutarioriparius]|uniref:Uncharacterized protein n=1 Tax=Miscanthus lutarioriparius TaxID=422564 RepID=A0A811MG93_9POAL|nr:unnamed protein product [Miscanthus lutarioriparius]
MRPLLLRLLSVLGSIFLLLSFLRLGPWGSRDSGDGPCPRLSRLAAPIEAAASVALMGNQCQNGTYGSNYNNYNYFQKEPLASRYYDGDDSEDCYSGPSRSSIADLIWQGLRQTLTSISVLGRKTPNVTEHYTLGRQLGEGLTGTTYLCTEISAGCQYACKSILKTKFRNMQDIEDVRLTIKDVYEDEEAVHIVMELCEGGELYDRIKKGNYSEHKAADLIKNIVGIIENFHSLGVMHRDLKPENFLLQDNDDDLSIKVIDFGLSMFFKPDPTHVETSDTGSFTETVGSPYYIAPEVWQKHYGPEADVWTAGVILYVLLSGVPPFCADTHEVVLDKVRDGHFDFESDQWHRISDSANDLIRKMLCPCPSERLKAHEVLKHPWICDNGVATHQTLDPTVLSRIDKLSAANKSKKLALQVIAKHLSEEEIGRLRGMFKAVDNGNSGAIILAELKEGLRKCGLVFKNIEISDIMEADGQANYGEFVTMMQSDNSALGWQMMESSMNVPLREAPEVY